MSRYVGNKFYKKIYKTNKKAITKKNRVTWANKSWTKKQMSRYVGKQICLNKCRVTWANKYWTKFVKNTAYVGNNNIGQKLLKNKCRVTWAKNKWKNNKITNKNMSHYVGKQIVPN